jgi:methionyl aminopeptidase
VLAIEPMVNAGKPAVKVLGDGWTAVTKDKALSAHFEHTVVVTGEGCRILTLPEESALAGERDAEAGASPERAHV